MKYELDYKKIGKRLKQRREKLGLSQDAVGVMLNGLSPSGETKDRTIRNHESGQSFPFKTLLKYCEIYDCDLGYLMGDYDEKDRDTHYICDQTGLSEEAVEILKDQRFYANPDEIFISYYDELSDAFIRIINHIIRSFKPLGDKKNDCFPTADIVNYYLAVMRSKEYEKTNNYKEAKQTFEEYVEFCLSTEPWSRDIAESVVSSGHLDGILPYDEKTQFEKDAEFFALSDYGNHLSFIKKDKRYQRIDVQDAFSKFLLSDFMEGETNGNDH
jgi:transcriptional regulator with XRE-family HTH domain